METELVGPGVGGGLKAARTFFMENILPLP